ncbi:uncharacterized protein DMENIID0001_082660 [Sergentomyia squamirostris]
MWIKVTFFLSTLTLIVSLPVRNKPLPLTQENIEGLKYLLKLRQMQLQEQLQQQPQEFLYSYHIPTPEELNAAQVDAEAAALQQMLPPQVSSEPNYYAMKPRKGTKKYQPNQKQIHLRNSPQVNQGEDLPTKSDYDFEDVNYDLGEQFYLPESGNHEAVAVAVETPDYPQARELNTGETYSAIRRKTEPQTVAASEDRVEFQMHGHAGPKSYKFGYDTGKGKNRQFRYEEVDNEGKLRGQYGYIDKRGKMHIVKYTSSPDEGFKAEKAS